MAVFPENMNRLDLSDTVGSLQKLESYIHYMKERVEFANRNLTRNVGTGGTATVEVLELVLEMTSALSRLQATLNETKKTVDALSNAMYVSEDGELIFTAETNLSIDCGEWE